MFLASYHFDGDPDTLTAAYDKMMASFPQGSLLVHICVRHAAGLTIFDACPSREDFIAFSTSPEFAAAAASAGLSTPKVVELGEVHRVLAGDVARA